MTGRSKPRSKQENGPEQRGKTAARSTKGKFQGGNPGGPGRRNRRWRGDLATPPTPAGDPGAALIACEARLELAEAEVDRVQAELADERAGAVRQSREWAAALHALERFPDARRAVLDEVLSPEEAERAAEASGPAAGASVARPGGEPAVHADPGVPLPEGKRGPELEGRRRTISDGVSRRPIPAGWGGTIGGTPWGRDELLDQGSPQERGRGRWGDEPPF